MDCDHYINNSKALREAMCFMMDPISGKKICYVQFPQRFDGIDRHDRYSNRNVVFFDVSSILASQTKNGLLVLVIRVNISSSFLFLVTDQHERIGWYPRTNICRDRLCFQKTGTLWV